MEVGYLMGDIVLLELYGKLLEAILDLCSFFSSTGLYTNFTLPMEAPK